MQLCLGMRNQHLNAMAFEQLSSHAHIFARSHTQEGGLWVSLLK
jgi:hypothetical protein